MAEWTDIVIDFSPTGNPRDETVSPDLVTGNSSVGPPRVCWRWPVEGGTSRVTKVTLELSGLPW